MRAGLPILLLALAARAPGAELELRGRIEPRPPQAVVTLHGANTPFSATTTSSNGRFRFRKLLAGPYVISVAVPGEGEVRRTLVVSPAFADAKGLVEVTVPFHPSASAAAEALEQRAKVSARELSIPDRAVREYEQAQRRLGARDVEGAVRRLERAVELAPQFVAAWNNLGTIAYQSGRYADAEKYFREALEHEPGSYAPLVNLGGTLLSLAKYEDALPYNQRAVRDQPEDALAHAQLGMNHFFLGELDGGLKHLNEAKRLDPSHFSHPQLLLAEIYLRRSDAPKAVAELEDFLKRHPDSPHAERIRERVERIRKRGLPARAPGVR
jgi:tetratricopeptide (TPR) repeat protein